jgi:hypothetical protein
MTRQRETTLLAHLGSKATSKLYLGDPAVVNGLVRGYVMGCGIGRWPQPRARPPARKPRPKTIRSLRPL